MQQRILGDSGVLVTPIGLGLAALGMPCHVTLCHAADLAHDYDPAAIERQTFLELVAQNMWPNLPQWW